MSNIIIAPSILSADFASLGSEVKMLENNGADWVHIDVMDGHFVPNLTIGAPVVKALRKETKLPLDVHLMISNPEKYISDFALAGADIITFHLEAQKDKTFDIIDKIHSFGIKAGVSIKPKTQISEIFDYIDKIDLLLVMTVEPGFGGQKFMSDCADKILQIKSRITDNIIVEVDGGINEQSAKYCKECGANALVAGNYIFSAKNKKQAIENLR